MEGLEARETPAVNFDYALGLAGAGGDVGFGLAADALGNAYVTGYFSGTADFDPGAGATTLTSSGLSEIFIAKYDVAGGLLWARAMNGPGTDQGYDVAVDGGGNVYITGMFSGTADFDPGAGSFTLTSAGADDAFLAKLDPTGNFLWAVALGGTGSDQGFSVELDAGGNVGVAGLFNGTADFDPSAGTTNLTSSGGNDIFVCKLDGAGNLLWARQMGGTGDDQPKGLAINSLGNLCLTGWFDASADFDPGAGTFTLNNFGSRDVFVVALDNGGNFLWAGQLGGVGIEWGMGIDVDAANNIYLSGTLNATGDYDPGAGTFTLSSAGGDDIFIAKLDGNGNFLWAQRIGNASPNQGHAIAVDAAGNSYTSGSFNGAVDFDPGAGTFNLSSVGSTDVFVVKLNSAGTFDWAGSFGGSGLDNNYAITLDGVGGIYTTGLFLTTSDFDPGPGTFNLTNQGNADIYLSKLVDGGISITPTAALSLVEAGSTDTYSIVLNNVPLANVVVTLSPDAQVSLSAGTLTFTPANWNTAQLVTVSAVDDAVLDGDHVGVISHTSSSSDPAFNALSLTSVTTSIVDNDPGTLQTFTTLTVNGDYTAAGVGLNGRTSGTINLAGVPAGATISAAYLYWGVLAAVQTPALASLTFAGTPITGGLVGSGFYESTFPFPNCYNYRADVTSLVAGNGAYNLAGASSSGTITTLGASLVAVYSSPLLASRTIVLLDGNAFVNNGIPTNLTQTVTIGGFTAPARVIAKTTYIVGDAWAPGSENVAFTGSAGTVNFNNAFDGSDGTWWDTDTRDVSSAIGPGSTTATTTSAFVNNESFNWMAQIFSIGSPGILDTPSAGSTDVDEAGTTDTVAYVLQTAPGMDVLVTLTPDSQVSTVPTVLTFTPANWNTTQTVTITSIDDALIEGAHTGLITPTVTSADPLYSGLPLAALTVNITDNDRVIGVNILQSGGSTSVAEGGAADTYTVVLLGAPSADVVISANPGANLNVAPTSLTFTPINWNTPQTVTVSAIDDTVFQGTRQGLVAHIASSTDTGYNGLGIASVTANISDNDATPGVSITQPAQVQEGAMASYTIVLQTMPAANVVVNLMPDAQLNVAPTSVTFTTADWNVPQTINVATVDDTLAEINQVGIITHTISSADAAYNALTISAVTVTIVDNDGTLVLGTDRDDRILVNFISGKVQAIVNGVSRWLPGPITQVLVLGQQGNDFVQITTPTVPVVVLGGNGSDAVWVVGSAGYNTFIVDTASVTLNNKTVNIGEAESFVLGGRTSNDTFRIQNLPTVSTEFKGDRGNDNIVAADTDNDWRITSLSSGTLNASLVINGIENWFGGAGDDAFTFTDRQVVAGKIDGGGGTNIVDYTAYTASVSVNLQTGTATGAKSLVNMQSLRGGLAADKLIGPNQSNAWTLSDNNVGDVGGILFDGFENLTGGTLDDTFSLSDGIGVFGRIDGGVGIDILDYAGYSTPVAINLQAKTATGLGGALNLEQFVGGSGDDTLTAGNVTNKWTLTATGTGLLNKWSFADFENLTGGSGADTFTLTAALADWLGVLNGGNGKDSLFSFAAGSNLWANGVPGAGTLNGRAFAGIEIRR